MSKNVVIILLLCCLVGAALVMVLLLRRTTATMAELGRLRLDPLSTYFVKANAELGSPSADLSRVVFFGDSRIAEWQGLPEEAAYEFVNRGVGGETTAQMLGRVERDVVALKPRFAVLQMGVNDLRQIGILPAQEGITAGCRDRIAEIVSRIRAAGITPVVTTIFPVGEIPFKRRLVWDSRMEAGILEINRWMRKGGLGKGVVVWDCDELLLGEDGKLRPELARDELHLNASGYERLSAGLGLLLVSEDGG